MLIGCLEREFLKNGLNSDVNSTLKSDLITDINFSIKPNSKRLFYFVNSQLDRNCITPLSLLFSGTSMHPVEATLYYSVGVLPALFGFHPVLALGCIADCAFGAWLGHDGFQVWKCGIFSDAALLLIWAKKNYGTLMQFQSGLKNYLRLKEYYRIKCSVG